MNRLHQSARKSARPELRSVLLLVVFLAGMTGYALTRARQETLDQRLVTAVRLQDDVGGAEALAAGADPNVRVYSHLPFSLHQWLLGFVDRGFQQKQTWLPALSLAVDLGDERMAQSLLVHGADINSRDVWGQSVLPWGTHARISMVQLLLNHGLNKMGQDEALRAAAFHHDFSIVRLLVAHGAEVNCQDPHTRITPLEIACGEHQRSLPIVKFLLAHGANPNLKDCLGATTLQFVMKQPYPNRELLHLLRKTGAV